MDELEFRRRTTAQPHAIDKQLSEFAKSNAERQRFINEMKDFDQQLHNAVNDITLPENLAERILLTTSLQEQAQQQQQTRNKVLNSRVTFMRAPLAIAASFIALLTVLFFSGQQDHALTSAGQHALTHVYHEISAMDKHATISLDSVNEKLATIGGYIDELPGKISFAMFCDFKGERGLHLVFESDFGPMTVFIVPNKKQSFGFGENSFHDERFAGYINRGNQADTILIANTGAPIDVYNRRISNAIRWL
ncbi:DUF3379 family protein [Pseudoalteromonas sp.]|uniref:DUF3379 family protein n=1 Tax=Pseudoalteromonas sp. TaxID=53249 RepID=UPI0035620A21